MRKVEYGKWYECKEGQMPENVMGHYFRGIKGSPFCEFDTDKVVLADENGNLVIGHRYFSVVVRKDGTYHGSWVWMIDSCHPSEICADYVAWAPIPPYNKTKENKL